MVSAKKLPKNDIRSPKMRFHCAIRKEEAPEIPKTFSDYVFPAQQRKTADEQCSEI